ncbi:MAG TPA: hypothetical protein VEH06_04245 [Candidatus Bathyarchaeia archaeon]|nr:hypothetical protein [Candidatus Bathyarchaeia archaeon]
MRLKKSIESLNASGASSELPVEDLLFSAGFKLHHIQGMAWQKGSLYSARRQGFRDKV